MNIFRNLSRIRKSQMNKIILILIVSLFSHITFGQVYLGLETGPGLISLNGNDITEEFTDHTISFSAGLTFKYHFSQKSSLKTKLAFERKGAVTKFEVNDPFGNITGDGKLHLRYNYLTIPLLYQFNFGNKVKFFINGGPYIGYLLKQKDVVKVDDLPKRTADNTDDFERLDFGMTAGIGGMIPINNDLMLTTEIQNNWGLQNLNKNTSSSSKLHTNATNLLFGIVYKLGQKKK